LSTERHVDDGGALATLGDDVIDGPVEACDDSRGEAVALLEDFDGDKSSLFGYAVSGAADYAGDMPALHVR